MAAEKAADPEKRDGLTFVCMAAGVMLAFSFEAYLNFMGANYIGH